MKLNLQTYCGRVVKVVVLAMLVGAVGACAGCGGVVSTAKPATELTGDNLSRLTNLYLLYQVENESQGPDDEATFKKFVSGLSSEIKDRMEISSDEDVFVSERDGEPFVVRYGQREERGKAYGLVFEKTGVDGMRMVGIAAGVNKEVDAAEYDDLMSGKAVSL